MSQDLKEFWTKVLDEMSDHTNMVSYEVWLEGLEPVEIHDNKLVLVSPTSMGLNVCKKKYADLIREAIAKINPTVTDITLIGTNEVGDYLKTHVSKSAPAEPSATVAAPMFNEKYTFSSFIVGKSNQFAHAAALAVAQSPGKTYNPLFLYGSSGLGKTHIMHAIGNFLLENRPDLRLAYLTSERFVNELVEALKSSSGNKSQTKDFRDRYRNVDVLMIDDIQFIEGKSATQEEFFHPFNDLYQSGRQIIISSDRAPKYLTELSDRLRSRFQSGLLADIQPPDLETRLAILRFKAEKENFNVDDEVFNFIAERAESNVREMEGLLQRVTFFASLQNAGQRVTLELATEALKDYLDNNEEQLTADRIIDVVCQYFHVSREDVISKKKNKEIVDPRMVSIYLITDMLNMPLASIGKFFGGRDHTTVIHARDKIADLVKSGRGHIFTAVGDIKDQLLQK